MGKLKRECVWAVALLAVLLVSVSYVALAIFALFLLRCSPTAS